MDDEQSNGWPAWAVVVSILVALLIGLFLGWIAHGLMMHRMMSGNGMMNGGMMGGNGMMKQGDHSGGMMGSKTGKRSGMMDRMMRGKNCPMMMQSMMDQMQSMSGMSGMMKDMDPKAMRQHCRSMRASMIAIMHGDKSKNASEETNQSLEQIEWIDGDDREWVQSIRGLVQPKDARDQQTVTVKVGAGENGLQFQPAVVRVDPGTTLRFEWTGNGGSHNVNPLDLDRASPLQYEQGDTYELTLSQAGSYRYICTPHRVVDMKGLVVVG